MTCIAWDGKTLSADKRVTIGGLTRTVTKIFRNGANELLCQAGDATLSKEITAWYIAGAAPDKYPESCRDKDDWPGLVVIKKERGCPAQIMRYERTPFPYRIEDKHFALGSGRDYALVAMHLGKSAKEAVEIACLFDSGCGNGIDTLDFE